MAGKKIAVVCTGAVGGYAGAHMVKAGEDVTFIDFWPEHVEKMKKDGLTITHLKDVEPFTVPVSPDGTTWLMSIHRCVDNFVHAATLAVEPEQPAVTLPAVRTSVRSLVASACSA